MHGPEKEPRTDHGGRRVVRSLQRGLEVLLYVVEAGAPLRLQEIVRHFDLDKASAYRILSTLEVAGLVSKQPFDKSYAVGATMLRWLASPRHDQQLIHLCHPHLERLANRTRESGHIGVLTGLQVTLIDVVPPDALVAIKHSVGASVELHCSAIGKALLAFMPIALQGRLLADLNLRRFTGNTIVDHTALRAELSNVRDLGYAVDDAEFNHWIYCIAAPILDDHRTAVASVGLSVFKPTLLDDPHRLALLRAEVCDCASAISQDLTRRPPL